jgi:hypothetical protein
MRISRTKRAEKNYRSIKEYITGKWGEKVAEVLNKGQSTF